MAPHGETATERQRELEEFEELDRGQFPDTISRRVTNQTGLACFLIAMLACVCVFVYAVRNGDPRRFRGIPDSDGNLCGVSPSEIGSPYVYVCQGSSSLRWSERICVPSCPSSWGTTGSLCPGGSDSDYASEPFADILCRPTDPVLLREFTESFLRDPVATPFIHAAQLRRAWQPILLSAVLALALGFIYLKLLKAFAAELVWYSLRLTTLVLTLLGAAFIRDASVGGDEYSTLGDSRYELLAGVAALGFACFTGAILCSQRASVEFAVECIEAACECIEDMPSLRLEPFLAFVFKATVLGPWIVGLLFLLSCLDSRTWDDSSVAYMLGYTPQVWHMLAFYLFMGFWLLETCAALSWFAIAFATEQWYFAAYFPQHNSKFVPIGQCILGYAFGLSYHLGSLSFGSLVIFAVRPVRIGLELLASLGNGCDCMCESLQSLNKNAYIDLAINAGGFCKGARHAMLVMLHEGVEAATLSGATWAVQLTGLGGISAAGAALTHLLCTQTHHYGDPHSRHFVADPVFHSLVAALACFHCALPFTRLFHHVADVLLFCCALEKKREQRLTVVKEEIDQLLGGWCMGRGDERAAQVAHTARGGHAEQPPACKALQERCYELKERRRKAGLTLREASQRRWV